MKYLKLETSITADERKNTEFFHLDIQKESEIFEE